MGRVRRQRVLLRARAAWERRALTFRGELHDSVDTVMRSLGELYEFKMAGAACIHGVQEVTVGDVMEDQGGSEVLHGVFRVPVKLRKV